MYAKSEPVFLEFDEHCTIFQALYTFMLQNFYTPHNVKLHKLLSTEHLLFPYIFKLLTLLASQPFKQHILLTREGHGVTVSVSNETGFNRQSTLDLLFEIFSYLLRRPGRRDKAPQSFELRIKSQEIIIHTTVSVA